MANGIVYLIGAGPGDPGLLTLRGAELLGRADVVLYDGLSNTDLLAHARSAEHISVGKHGQSRIWQQSEIIAEILAHARAGRTVARLKGGDPAVFARTAEEVAALREAGIDYEIVPGITAALAAGSFAGIPITHRGLASAVALVTGHEEPDKAESALDWDGLARFPGTLVIYMGVTTAGAWTSALIAGGKSPDTPVAIVRRCSLPDQQTIRCRLDEVAGHLTPASKFRPPVITIVGPVTQIEHSMDWLASRPLFGQTVMVTRPVDQADSMAKQLKEMGADVIVHPAIEIAPPETWTDVDAAIASLGEFDDIVFCSHNGVRFFLDRVLQSGRDLRSLAGLRIAAVGARTAQTLASYHLAADVVPDDFRAESLAEEMVPTVAGKKVLIIRASRGRDLLADRLRQAGGHVTEVAAYVNRDVIEADPNVVARIDRCGVDWITVTSSATAENLHRMYHQSLHRSKLASLSPVTTKTLNQLGYQVTAEADPYTIESLIKSICQHSKSESE